MKSPLAYIAPENQVAVKWQQRQGTSNSLNQNVSSDGNGVNDVFTVRDSDGSYIGWFNPDELDRYISIMEFWNRTIRIYCIYTQYHRTGYIIGNKPNEDTKVDAKEFDYYLSSAKIDGIEYVILSDAAEMNNGDHYYDHHLIRKEDLSSLTQITTLPHGILSSYVLNGTRLKQLLQDELWNNILNKEDIIQQTRITSPAHTYESSSALDNTRLGWLIQREDNSVLDARDSDGSYIGWFNPDELDRYISIMKNAEPVPLC